MRPAPLLFLARALPRRAARPLGGAWGRLACGLLPGRRRQAVDNLRRAFPDFGAAELDALARRSFAQHFAALADIAAVERLDARRLCRHLRFAGWEHLEAAESVGRGVVLLAPRLGLWRLAVLAVELYRGSVTIAGALAEDYLLGRLAGCQKRRLGRAVLAGCTIDDATQQLAGGGRLAVLAELPAPGAVTPVESLAPRWALATGAPVLPILALLEPGGVYRIAVREPIDPEGTDPDRLSQRCHDAVAREIHCRPELAAWWPS